MQLFRVLLAAGVLCAIVSGRAQDVAKPSPDEMSLEDLRVYMDVLHIKDADERGVRAQMELQKTQLPPWFPPALFEEMTKSMLNVDFSALEYPFVKPCLNAADMHAMTALFQTPEGQAYASKATGTMVSQEAAGASPLAAHDQAEKEDHGLPKAALDRLTVEQRGRVLHVFNTNAISCISEGFRKGSAAVSDARTQAVRKMIDEHRAELQAAKQKYEAASPAPPTK